MTRWWNTRVVGFLLIVGFLAFWEASSRMGIVDSPNWPPVSTILSSAGEVIVDGSLFDHTISTLRRMLLGYSLAVIAGILMGIAIGYFRFLYNLLEPSIELLRPIPGPAYLPVLILFLGIDDAMKVTLVFLASFFPIVLNTYGGIKAVDPVQIQTAKTFGLGSGATLREVVLPAASPQIFTGMRISLAIALILAILSEMVAATNGLGFLILNAQRTFRAPLMYVSLFTLAGVGYAFNRIFLLVEGRVLRWHIESRLHAG